MKARSILLMAVALLLFVACGKEKKRFDGTGGTVPEGKQLAALYNVDLYGTRTSQFEWNDNGLLQKIKEDYDSDGEMDGEWSFTYEGTNVKEFCFFEFEGAYEEKYICTYDGELLTQMRAYRNNVLGRTTSFSYNADGILVSVQESDGDLSAFVWHDGNVMRVDNCHVIDYDNSYCTYRYDSKKNPYATLPMAYSLSMVGPQSLSINNITRETYSFDEGYSYTYVYDGDYPSQSIRNADNGSDIDVTYFKYTDGTGSEPEP